MKRYEVTTIEHIATTFLVTITNKETIEGVLEFEDWKESASAIDQRVLHTDNIDVKEVTP